MRSLFLIAAASLAVATPVLAQPAPGGDRCTQSQPCQRPDAKPQQDHRAQNQRANTQQHHAAAPSNHGPRVGERVQNGRDVPQAQLRHLPKPPKGQSYRVVDDRVVRVDSSTLKIMAVVGLLSALN